MRKPHLSTTPPKLPALIGRASPKGSKNFGGIGKAADAPNKSASPFGGGGGGSLSPIPKRAATPASPPTPLGGAPMGGGPGLPTQDFCKGGKVISTKTF
jgi:hypothetical protein